MCYATTCRQCGKTTWAGCGAHVDEVKASVPATQWCPGHADAGRTGSGNTDSGNTGTAQTEAPKRGGWFGRRR